VNWLVSLILFLGSLGMLVWSAAELLPQPPIPYRTTAAAVLGPLALLGLLVWGLALRASMQGKRGQRA
jgi:hypothetical protein